MANYRITRKAKRDLSTIWNYTYDTWSEKQADKYLRELMGEFKAIGENPRIGRNYNDIDPTIFGLKKNKHIIFYRTHLTGEVDVIRILHERMDIPGRMEE